MNRSFPMILAAAMVVSLPAPSLAQGDVLSAREANRLLFGTRGAVSALSETVQLSDKDRNIIEQIGPSQKYYGAIAYSPDEGLLSEATVAAANHHTVEVARARALEGCNEKRAQGTAACVIAADIVPRRYRPGRALQLSIDATTAFGDTFRKAPKPRAFAISAQTGLWGYGASDAEAIDACGAGDCKVIARD